MTQRCCIDCGHFDEEKVECALQITVPAPKCFMFWDISKDKQRISTIREKIKGVSKKSKQIPQQRRLSFAGKK
jgi:hypothetical protein